MKRKRKADANRTNAAAHAAALRRTKEIAGRLLKQAEVKQADTVAEVRRAWRAYHQLAMVSKRCNGSLDGRCLGCAELEAMDA